MSIFIESAQIGCIIPHNYTVWFTFEAVQSFCRRYLKGVALKHNVCLTVEHVKRQWHVSLPTYMDTIHGLA
jgi:hypothetical protein